jgi:hypothetical protein
MGPEEAEVVRTIFTCYLERGSMGALLTELDRQGIRTKLSGRRDGRRSGGIRFGVGSLAHLLKNRFYIGEVVYRATSLRYGSWNCATPMTPCWTSPPAPSAAICFSGRAAELRMSRPAMAVVRCSHAWCDRLNRRGSTRGPCRKT